MFEVLKFFKNQSRMSLCNQCSQSLPPENDFVSCGGCKNGYHYACSGVRETVWRKYTAESKQGWRCVICKTKTVSADIVNSLVNDNSSMNSENLPTVTVTTAGQGCTNTMTRSERLKFDSGPKFDEVGYLRELLRHKDLIIENQADLIKSLKEQIVLLKAGRTQSLAMGDKTDFIQASNPKSIVRKSKTDTSHANASVSALRVGSKKQQNAKSDPGAVEQGNVREMEVNTVRDSGGNKCASNISNYDVHEALTKAKLHDIIHLSGDAHDDGEWRKAQPRRRNKPIIGKKADDSKCGLRAAESYSHWHVYRLHPKTVTGDVEAYLCNQFPGVLVEKLNSSNPELYSSFKVTVKENDGDRILDESLWPNGTRINRFFLARNRKS